MIKKILLPSAKLKPLFTDASKLQFGCTFTDYMFTMEYTPEKGWHDATIKPYQALSLDPAASVLHYGQEVFEGQKAYQANDGKILLFRSQENAKRLNTSLKRLCMPEIPEEIYLEAVYELVKLEKRWIPQEVGTSLYIRPVVIATEPVLGVKASRNYLFYIILSPTAGYFQGGFNPIGLWVSEFFIRAAIGGTGEAKTGGNYASSILVGQEAQKNGYNQVLWLDAQEHKYIEEVGASNIFFVIGEKLVTPKLSGSILSGITRKSVLQIANDLGIQTEERAITIQEVVDGIKSGLIKEIFGSGTAAVIIPVGKICYKKQEYVISHEPGVWTQKFYTALTDIQYGKVTDPYGWMIEVL